MTDYKSIFDIAQNVADSLDYVSLFSEFHDHPELFHFIMAPTYQQNEDRGALEQAQNINSEIFKTLYDKGPSLLGHGSTSIDGVESRHILLMTWLITNLGTDWGDVIEIGGGYGNCLRLVNGIVDYTSWGIIDLDYISDLQKWFLTNTNIPLKWVYFTHSDTTLRFSPKLVIGTHSLSEMSLEDFNRYHTDVIKNAKQLFYVSQRSNPSKELLDTKLEMINQDFNLEDRLEYEGGASIMYLFRNKQ